jgi:hypothetical protein
MYGVPIFILARKEVANVPLRHVCLSVACDSSKTAEWIFVKFDIWSFAKIFRHIPILVNIEKQ